MSDVNILALPAAGRDHLKQIGDQRQDEVLDEFMEAFNRELERSFLVDEAWRHVREVFNLDEPD